MVICSKSKLALDEVEGVLMIRQLVEMYLEKGKKKLAAYIDIERKVLKAGSSGGTHEKEEARVERRLVICVYSN